MCKQDVQIARSMVSNTTPFAVAQFQIQKVLNGNPERLRVILAQQNSQYTAFNEVAAIGTWDGTNFVALWTLQSSTPSVVLAVEDFGKLLLGPLYLTANSGGGWIGNVTELYLTTSLDDL